MLGQEEEIQKSIQIIREHRQTDIDSRYHWAQESYSKERRQKKCQSSVYDQTHLKNIFQAWPIGNATVTNNSSLLFSRLNGKSYFC